MSKYCNNCGAEMEDDVVFCPNCGAQDQPAYNETPMDAAPEEGKANPLSNMKTLIIGAVAAVAVIILAIVIFGSSPNKAVKNYQAYLNGNAGKMGSMAPSDYWKYVKEEGEVTKATAKKEYKDMYKDMKEELEDTYGKNVKYTIKVTDKDKMSNKDLKAIGDALEEEYEIDDKKVKAGWEMEVEMTIKGKDDDDEIETTLNVVKIGGQWYVLNGTSFPCDGAVGEAWED